MKLSFGCAKLAMLVLASLLSFSASARDSSDGGCSVSEWTCYGDPVVVTGDSPVSPDSFGCRKDPLNCLPRPPRPGSTPTDGGGVGPGRGGSVKDHEATNAAALSEMQCGELRDLEKTYELHVEAAKFALENHQNSLKDADLRLADPIFSAGEMNRLQDLANTSCGTYELTRDRRLNGPKVCTESAGDRRPEVCRAPPPSRVEMTQALICRDHSTNLNARRGDQVEWARRKAAAQVNVQTMASNLRYVQGALGRIRAEMKRKNCPA